MDANLRKAALKYRAYGRPGNRSVRSALPGAKAPMPVLTSSAAVRRIVNMTALTVVDADTPR